MVDWQAFTPWSALAMLAGRVRFELPEKHCASASPAATGAVTGSAS